MADDDNINIFEEFYDSIKPGGSFDQGALNLGKAVTDVLTPNEQTQAEMDAYNQQRQDALNFLYSASGVDPESFQGKALESQFRQNKELQKLLGFDSNMLKELKYDFAKAGQFLFGDANVGLTTMQQEGTKFKELPFNQKLGIAMLPIDALDIIGLGALAKGGISPLIKTGMKVYGKKSGKTIQDLLNDEQVLKAIEAEQPGFIQELDTTLGGGIIQKRFMRGKKETKGPVGAKPGEFGQTAKETVEQQRKRISEEEIRKTAEAISDVQPLSKNFTAEDFAKDFNEFAALPDFNRRRSRYEQRLKNRYRDQYETLRNDAQEKGLIQTKRKQDLVLDNISERLNQLDIDSLDPNNPDEIFKIINEERVKLDIPELKIAAGKTPDSSVLVKRLFEKGLIDEGTFNKIKAYGQKRYELGMEKAVEASKTSKAKKAQKRADAAVELINKLKKDRTEPLALDSAALISRLKESNPDLFSADYALRENRSKLIRQMVELNPEIGDSLISTGQRINPETLTVIQDTPRQEDIFAKGFVDQFAPGEDYIGMLRKDPQMRFFNNLRRSSGKSAEDFLGTIKIEDIQRGGDKYDDYMKFKKIDEVRLEANERLKPILKKIFDQLKRDTARDRALEGVDVNKLFKSDTISLQLAHKYKLSGVTEGFAADKINKGAKAEELYIDISDYNSYLQNGLENRARKAYETYQKTGELEALEIFQAIDNDMRILGIEGQVAPGVKIGRAMGIDEKLSGLMINAMDKGILTQKEVNQAITAANKIAKAKKDYEKMFKEKATFQSGGLVGDVDDIFEEEQELLQPKPRITVEFGDAAKGTKRSFGEEKPKEDVFDIDQKTSAAPMTKTFDVQPTENIFTGEMEQANLKLPFFKLFTKPPVNETAPIPTPKENLNNPTKKQKQSLEQEKIKKQDDVFDPTPEDNDKVNLVDDVTGMDIAVTPKTNQPITGVFYSDIERVLARPDTPEIFINKKALLDFFRKNRIRDSEFRDYQIESLLRIYDENTPIPKKQVIDHLRQSPIRGMHVHATGQGSEIINPYGEKPTAYSGYAEPGYISDTQRERVLYIPKNKLPGDSGADPQGIFQGESISQHGFGIPDESYIVGWTRLTDRNAILPTKLSAPQTASKVPGLTRERERAQRQLSGLYAEAINKLNREGVRRGLNQADLDVINELSLEQMLTDYGDTLGEISPGLVDQMDELIVKTRDLDSEIAKGSNVDTSGVVRVAFADEIQSDIMQAAAGRKQKLVATLRKIQDEGKDSTTLPQLSRIGNQALEFFEENKSVFRPLKRSQTEVDLIGEKLVKLDAEVDEIINRYIETRELDPASVTRLKEALTQNIDEMINELIVIDSKTYDGLFPDIPFKKREEWADALIKKDLFELAYRKFVLKEENVPDFYAVTPDQFVIDRYNFKGNSATPMDVRAADKKKQIDYFTARGEFLGSEYKGIGMSEFYGGPNAKTPDGKHYTSVIEKILKTQAKSNNSEFMILNVQTKGGAKDVFKITDQNGNMVATLSNRNQAETLINNNPNYRLERISVPTDKNTTPSFAIKITEEMLEPYKTHKARGGLVEMIDIFEVA